MKTFDIEHRETQTNRVIARYFTDVPSLSEAIQEAHAALQPEPAVTYLAFIPAA